MTGGMLPPGADAIVMIEDTSRGDMFDLYVDTPGSSKFIRRTGSDVRQGETVLNAGDVVGSGTVGLLSSLGITRISCHTRPRVGILSTGNELVPVHTKKLQPAKIRDSNSHALEAAVLAAGGIVEARLHAPDDKDAIREALLKLSGCDVVISSGGVSVGDADFVKGVVEEIGSLDFWRIAIKPGKPLAFGRVGNALFFGLPGNPVSSLVTFELFVRPVLRRLAGHRKTSRPRITATLAEPLPHEPGRREFVRARLDYRDGEAFATTTGAQGSHRVSSLVGADALLVAHEDHGDYEAGTQLPALLLL
jgi:molybdopterin molybdotransferase